MRQTLRSCLSVSLRGTGHLRLDCSGQLALPVLLYLPVGGSGYAVDQKEHRDCQHGKGHVVATNLSHSDRATLRPTSEPFGHLYASLPPAIAR